jgi:hypothetical protein
VAARVADGEVVAGVEVVDLAAAADSGVSAEVVPEVVAQAAVGELE